MFHYRKKTSIENNKDFLPSETIARVTITMKYNPVNENITRHIYLYILVSVI